MSSNVLEARAVIVGEDRTGPAFEAVKAHIAEVTKQMASVSHAMASLGAANASVGEAATNMARFAEAGRSLSETAARVQSVGRGYLETATAIDKATRAAERFGQASRSAGAGMRPGQVPGAPPPGGGSGRRYAAEGAGAYGFVKSVAGAAATVGALEAGREAVKASAEQQHERVRMNLAGFSPAEIARADALAGQLATQYPSVGKTDITHGLRNARSIVGDFDDAAASMPDLLKLRVVAQAARPGADVSEDFDQLLKGLEIKGVAQDPKQFHDYMQGIAKGLNVFGDTLKPYQYYEMFKYGRQATPALSERFILGTAPALAQELGGSSYGRAVSAFNNTTVNGHMRQSSLKEFVRLGLADAADVEYGKDGAPLRFKAGKGPKGWETAQSDPNEWTKKYLIPALRAAGIADPAVVTREIGQLFQDKTAAQLVAILAEQQNKIDKNLAQVDGARGLEAAPKIMAEDPIIAFQGLAKAARDLGAAFGVAAGVAPALNSMAQAMERWAVRLNGFPERLKQFEQEQVEGDTSTPPGQAKLNRMLNAAWAASAGLDDPGTGEPLPESKKTAMIKTARRLAAQDREQGAPDEAKERAAIAAERAEAERLRRQYEAQPKPGLFGMLFGKRDDPASLQQSFKLRDDAKRREDILNGSMVTADSLNRAADNLEAARNASGDYERARHRFRLPAHMDPTVPDGPGAFPMRAGFDNGSWPAPHDDGPHWTAKGLNGPNMPAAGVDLGALLSGKIMAQVDPDMKVPIMITIRVDGTSEFFRVVAQAEAAASGSASATTQTTSGSTGRSYPQTAPTGRSGGGIGRA